MIGAIEWVAVAVCIASNIMVIKLHRYAFLTWTAGNCVLIALAVLSGNWAKVMLFGIYSAINIWGFWEWTKGGERR
jgi:nicotinamide riboside transporter PnuC